MSKKHIKTIHNRNKNRLNRELYDKLKLEEKKRMAERTAYLNKVSEELSLPSEMLSNSSMMILHGRSSLHIENYKKILEYNSETIRIQGKSSIICVIGTDLKISYYARDEMKISGLLNSVSFE